MGGCPDPSILMKRNLQVVRSGGTASTADRLGVLWGAE